MMQRIREEHDLGTPGREMAAKLNQEFKGNWTLQNYFQKVCDAGLEWRPGRKGRHGGPTRFLPESERESCYRDPAYEARNNMVAHTVCRECFGILKGCLHLHLLKCHDIIARNILEHEPPVF